MRRPLALIGLTAMSVLAVCFYNSRWISYLLFVVSLLGLIITIAIPKIRRMISPAAVFATIMVSVTLINLFAQFCVFPIQSKYVSEDAEVSAVLCEEGTYDNGKYFYELKALTIDGEKADVRMCLSSSEALMINIGDKIEFTSDIRESDYGRYLSDRIYLDASVYYEEEIKLTPAETKPLYAYVVELREKIRSSFYLELKYDNASLASAVLLGDNSGFEDDVYLSMKRAGLTHVVVVSGLHLSIITLLYRRTFGRLIKNRYLSFISQILLVFAFLCLTGFGKSSIRATVMLMVIMISDIFNRESDSVNSLGLAAIIMFIANPYIVGDVGVLLSFSATFGIVGFSGILETAITDKLMLKDENRKSIWGKVLRYVVALFSTTFTAVMATLPVTVIFFGKVSLVQIVSNLTILPFVQYFMVFAALTSALHYVPFLWWLKEVFAFLADIVGSLMLSLAKWFAELPFAYVKADYGFVFFWIVSSVILLAIAYLLRRKGKGLNLICGVLSVIVMISGFIGHTLVYKDIVTVHIVPSDNGQSVIINSHHGNVLLVSSGEKYTSHKIISELEDIYTDNRLMVVSSSDNNASVIGAKVSDMFDYQQILMYDTDDKSDHAKKLADTYRCINTTSDTGEISLFDESYLYISDKDKNVYQYFTCRDTSVLFLSDCSDLKDIPKSMLTPDILVTSGLSDNMELVDFDILIANGSDFEISAVVDYYRDHPCKKIAVNDTITFDITG